MNKKKLIFAGIALVLAVALIIVAAVGLNGDDIVIQGSDIDTSIPNTSTESNLTSDENSSESSNVSSKKEPITNPKLDDGIHINDLNNTSKKATLKNNCYSTGYPIADKTVKLKVMIKDYTNQANYKKMKINDFFKEKMNIEIEWNLVAQHEVDKKLTLAYATGDLPDMAIGMAPFSIASQWQYVEQGLIIQLDDYIEKYAPNVKRLLKENADARYVVTAEDGHIYSLPMLNESMNQYAAEGLYINKVWLDNLNLDMPNSTNSFMKVLNSFKTNDPNGNGKADEIPLSLITYNSTGILPGCLYGPFGLRVYGGYAGYGMENGKYRPNFTTDNYKMALLYYRTLYNNGLIDQDWFANSAEMLKTKLNTNTTTVGAFVTSDLYSLVNEKRAKEYVLVPPFRDKSAKKAEWSIGSEYAYGEWFLVTKACKYPEIAVRFADYFYSLEGCLTAMQGPQGYNWDVKSDGTIYMTENYYKGKYKSSDLTPGNPLPHYIDSNYMKLVDVSKSKYTTPLTKKRIENSNNVQKTYMKVATEKIKVPALMLTSEEIMNKDPYAIADYVRVSTVQFLNGTRDINSFWDNYVSVCKSLGCDEEAASYQKPYDRYLKQLNK